MFTGIVQAMGRVAFNGKGRLRVRSAIRRPPRGASVAVNGTCLTVVGNGGSLEFDMTPETLSRTNLGRLRPGDFVNLEKSLRAGDPLGGHFVSGHVDARARVLSARRLPDGSARMRFSLPRAIAPLVAEKGSIAVDGVSLTVSRRGRGFFEAVFIPYTLRHTTLGKRKPGDAVNLEADLIARHLDKILKERGA